MTETTLYLVDASPYIFRAYFALPPTVRAPDGTPMQAAYGFVNTLLTLLRRDDLTHLFVAFDASLTTSFRNELHAGYKSSRDLPPPELVQQLDACRTLTEAMGATSMSSERYEADDLIAAALKQHRAACDRAVIVTSDKDLAQLVDDDVTWFDLAKERWWGPSDVEAAFGVRPSQICDYLALRGDPVDDIPGVAGIGPKSAAALLHAFGDLDSLYQRIDEVPDLKVRGAASMARKLREGEAEARLSRRLAELVDDIEGLPDADTLVYRGGRPDAVDDAFSRYGFDRIRERVPRWESDHLDAEEHSS